MIAVDHKGCWAAYKLRSPGLFAQEFGGVEDAFVELSSEHADFFVKNLVAIKAEERLVLMVKQPAAFATIAALPTETFAAAASAAAPTSKK